MEGAPLVPPEPDGASTAPPPDAGVTGNGQDTTDVPANADAAPSAPPPHQITRADQEVLAAYFERVKWPLNLKLTLDTTGNQNNPTVVLWKSLGLKRPQVVRYLRKWKDKKYNHGGIVLPDEDPEVIKERIFDTLSETPQTFVANVLLCMTQQPTKIDTELESYCREHLTSRPHYAPLVKDILVQAQSDNEQLHPLVKILTTFFESMVGALAEVVPKKASGLSKAELAYIDAVDSLQAVAMTAWVSARSGNTDSLPSSAMALTMREYRSTLVVILLSIRASFQKLYVKDVRPSVAFPDSDLVSKWAAKVVYYSASSCLGRCKHAKSAAEEDRLPYKLFAEAHLLTVEQAEEANLPTGMVNIRETSQGGFHRCSVAFYNFIRKVESVFINNLTLEMMTAYQEGDLIVKIGNAILENESMRSDFRELADEADLSDTDFITVFTYLMNMFTTMRGRWFVKIAKGQESTKSIFTKTATRKKVAHSAEVSKAANTVTAEENIYIMAESNILSTANESEDIDIESDATGVERSVIVNG